MSIWIDQKYLKLIPLKNFKENGIGKYNFRCPVCGDSRKDLTKARGHANSYNNSLVFSCFNCGMKPLYLGTFLKFYHPELYSDYIKEIYLEKDSFKPKKKVKDIFSSTHETINLQLVNDLPVNHEARKFLIDRKITKDMSEQFYYSENFSKWLNPKSKMFSDKRIVLPFYTKYKKIFGVQGRTIENKIPKYLTHKYDEDNQKIFGLDRIDFSKKIYVVEGPFDSLFLDNCLAFGGTLSNLSNLLKLAPKENFIIVPDNDFRNAQTRRFIENSIDLGFNTVIWDKFITWKDINEAIICGYTKEEICDIITKSTYSGLQGIIKFKLKG